MIALLGAARVALGNASSSLLIVLLKPSTMNELVNEPELVIAARDGDVERVRRLLAEGVDADAGNDLGYTALQWASRNGHTSTVAILLECGAVVDQENTLGLNALMYAAGSDRGAIVKLLLDNGAVVDRVSSDGQTALLLACCSGCTASIAVMLDYNVSINNGDKDGRSPLMYASMFGKQSVVRLLLSCDVDTTRRDVDGNDCLDVARNDATKQLVVAYRSSKEKQRLIDIGLGFASKQLPLLLLVNIYEQTVVFEEQQISLYNMWEILKILKK